MSGSNLLNSEYMQDANDANASGHATVHRDKDDPNDARNIDWQLGGKWIRRRPSLNTPPTLHYDLARNGCSDPIRYKGKVVYYKVRGTTTPNSIPLEDMEKMIHAEGNGYKQGWMELEHFYVVDESATQTRPFLSMCQTGLNY